MLETDLSKVINSMIGTSNGGVLKHEIFWREKGL